ncbi:tRNA pseudouridine synthase 1 [Spathaspora sp. JA1]|nr:tRNA pseudouridine synthase 1 [Spathaspora sp. JA1]
MSEQENVTSNTIQYEDQVDDSVYKRDQKSKWTRTRTGDRIESEAKRTRKELGAERRKKEYEDGNSMNFVLTSCRSNYVAPLDERGNPIKSDRRPKRKCAVMIGYCGTGYNGMQLQNDPAIPTIERDLYDAFGKAGAISQENAVDIKKSGFMRAARTDKGVHAAGNVVSLKLIIEDPDIIAKINAELPDQIRVWGIQRTTKGFDCRKLCSSRIYEYLLPTYSLLPPKNGTVLSDLLKEKRAESPDLFHDDPEGTQWWEQTYQKVLDAGITQEQLDSIANVLEPDSESATPVVFEDGEITEFGKLVKQVKAIENESRRSFKTSTHRLDQFRNAMKQYEGTHNFHNFTIGKHFKDPSASRYMKSTTVSDPFVIEGTEWVSIKIHGQSFMLHQIRKMIAMATMVVRIGCPVTIIQDFFGNKKINIPKAPALGLLLENPVYEAYNQTLQKMDYDPIDFTKYDDEMEAFKMKYIYDKIYAEEHKENVFYGFFGYIDTFKSNTDDERPDGTSVFDFLKNYTSVKSNEPVKEQTSEQ